MYEYRVLGCLLALGNANIDNIFHFSGVEPKEIKKILKEYQAYLTLNGDTYTLSPAREQEMKHILEHLYAIQIVPRLSKKMDVASVLADFKPPLSLLACLDLLDRPYEKIRETDKERYEKLILLSFETARKDIDYFKKTA